MKKFTLLFIFLMSMHFSFAQQAEFGIRLGPSLTTFGGGDADGSEFRFGFHAGAYVGLELSDQLVFEPGIQFARKGAKNSEFGTTIGVRNDYLDFPLLLKLRTGESFYVFVGPQPSFLLSSALVLEEAGNKVTIDGSEIKDLWNGFDFAAVLGFGVNIQKGLGVQLSYEHGLTNISEGDNLFNRGFKLSFHKSF
ncbi:porin family protein [Cecembia sp.]|uniref:porin family protein n=1 Tax=Cecembia sp. TaxID=1898110 RepID=UPI0025BE4688|nr:porin family protein [Cecembia sp.]